MINPQETTKKNKSKNQKPYVGEVSNIRQVRNREDGFFTIDNIFIDKIARHCGPYGISVYLSLSRHADLDKQTCFPSRELIAEETGMKVKTVSKYTKELIKLGVIKMWQSKKKDGTYNNNLYTILNIEKWEYKPRVNEAMGVKERKPQELNSLHRGHQTPNKETNPNETNKKDDFLKNSKTGGLHFSNFKPDCLKGIENLRSKVDVSAKYKDLV